MSGFPTPRLRRFFRRYRLAWYLGLPFALIYLHYRARRDSDYRAHLAERFGRYRAPLPGAVWVHAVSLGELRSAVPVIQRLLADGEKVVTTHFTPAGRRESETVFAADIAADRLRAVWIPFEFPWAFRRFFRAFRPRFGLVMEIEIWPEMIRAAHAADIPLIACNAQYPQKSFDRDRTSSVWRHDLYRGLAGACVKSDLQAERFRAAGCPDIHVTGELRFDQPVPAAQVKTGTALRDRLARRTLTVTSVVKGEDDVYIPLIKATRGPDAPMFVYVPRAPERFDETCDRLQAAGLRVARRSAVLAGDLSGDLPPETDVLLGDSMGEMYFYLALCDAAIIGGGFVEKGAHNISEPLALAKPVIVGPHTWTIEFPIVEALAAGAATQVQTPQALTDLIASGNWGSGDAARAFFATQQGSVDRTMAAIRQMTPPRG